jgi:hypothetical protein
MPLGVPAGGIFRQGVLQPDDSDSEELSPDSIAVDFSSLVPVADAPRAVAVALHGVGLAPVGVPAANAPLGIDVSRPATFDVPGRGPIELPGGPALERAELPDIPLPEPPPGPAPLGPNEEGSARAGRSSDTASDHGAGEGTVTVRVAIYGAASLLLGVSAPALIAACRRDPGREDVRESTGDAVARTRVRPVDG